MARFRNCGFERPEFLGTLWQELCRSTGACAKVTLLLTPEESGDAPAVEFWVTSLDPKDRSIRARYDVVFRQRSAAEAGSDVTLWAGDDEAVARAWARAAEIAKTIATQVADDPVLRVAGSFAELHDYCDANCLGEQEAFLDSCGWTGNDDAKDQATLVASTDILNNAQTIVDYWLRAHN